MKCVVILFLLVVALVGPGADGWWRSRTRRSSRWGFRTRITSFRRTKRRRSSWWGSRRKRTSTRRSSWWGSRTRRAKINPTPISITRRSSSWRFGKRIAPVTSSDTKCTSAGGSCMYTSSHCSGSWRSGLCSGPSSRKCCVRSITISTGSSGSDRKCTNAGGNCMYRNSRCSGTWKSGLCSGPASRKCCVRRTITTGSIRSCSLVTYTNTKIKGFQGKQIKIDPGFRSSMDTINRFAASCGVTVHVISSFRKHGAAVSGAIVEPATRSNHLVGHAIDVNLSTKGGWCNSGCLKSQKNTQAKCFTDAIQSASGLRWGGIFRKTDPVHIDDSLNNRNPSGWSRLFKVLQRNC